jgi:ribosomal protein S18 acetylase RimI-like enzyme
MSRATLNDLPAIMALEAAGFERGRWSEDSWRSELAQGRPTGGCAPLAPPDHAAYVHRDPQGRPVAVVALSQAGDVAELLRLIVQPERRRQGLGRELVAQALAWAELRGLERVLLEVAADNTAASALYRQAGFQVIARRADYYGPGVDAWVMERRLTVVPSPVELAAAGGSMLGGDGSQDEAPAGTSWRPVGEGGPRAGADHGPAGRGGGDG